MLQNVTNGVTSLSERQLKALPFLATSPTLTEGTKLAEISRTTFYRWMEDDDFRRELERLRSEAVEFAQLELKGLMLKSVMVLGEAMEDSNPYIRLRAAQIAMNTHLKANEMKEIEKRLALLDDALLLWGKSYSAHISAFQPTCTPSLSETAETLVFRLVEGVS